MKETELFDLEGYSKAIAAIVDRAAPSVVAVKSAAYRVASGVIFRENSSR